MEAWHILAQPETRLVEQADTRVLKRVHLSVGPQRQLRRVGGKPGVLRGQRAAGAGRTEGEGTFLRARTTTPGKPKHLHGDNRQKLCGIKIQSSVLGVVTHL